MATRWNGIDLHQSLTCEQGLTLRVRPRKGKREEIEFYFLFIKRVRAAARQLTPRDDELIEAVLRHSSLSEAARNIAPDAPETMRSYLSQRFKSFREIVQLFLQENEDLHC